MAENTLRETARVEAFSDGVIAIAISLLALSLAVPSHGSAPLATALLDAWPHYLAFVTSFVTIGIIWINHHRVFTHIRRVSHGLLLWNGLLLMNICLIPFTTGLVAEHIGRPDARIAAAVYSASFVFTTVSFNLLWRHATHHQLLDRRVDAAVIQRINRQYGFGPLLYLATTAAAFYTALGSVIVNAAIAAFFALPAFTLADSTRHVSHAP
ncbi:MAG: TMEM175 family protein [Polyangiales bacterium]